MKAPTVTNPKRLDECVVYTDGERNWLPWEIAERVIAERDRYREALEVCKSALEGDHTKAGEACGVDACALCWAQSHVASAFAPEGRS